VNELEGGILTLTQNLSAAICVQYFVVWLRWMTTHWRNSCSSDTRHDRHHVLDAHRKEEHYR
jgi:hypothetical protein